ncbi:MAG: xanthine dehydrogenase family protein molybdopterin-binding subunit [Chloroflexota bacterium]
MDEFSVIGKHSLKYDWHAKLTGTARYTDDLKLPRMIYGRLLRSPHPHARIVSIDTSRAEKMSGVFAVVTGTEIPIKFGILPSSQDETALAIDKVRYVGEAVAAVAAVDEWTAEEACGVIDVVYDVLPPVMSIEAALDDSKVRLHEWTRRANVQKEVELEFGDLDAGFAAADYVREDEFFYEGNSHVPMENHAVLAAYEPTGKVTVWSSTQTPHYLHRELSKVLSLPPSHIRIIVPPVGGGFGGKSEAFAHEVVAPVLSRKSGRPVLIGLSREEVFYCHRGRHPVKMWLRTGVKRDGSITAMHFRSTLDGGAYGSYGVATTYYTGALNTLPYRVPSYRFEGRRVFTNKPPCGPKRGHGTVQPRFAIECQMDKIATDLSLDPAEMRIRNCVEQNSWTVNHLRVTSCGLPEAIEKVVQRTGWQDKHGRMPLGRGIGLAASVYLSGAGLPIYWNPLPHSGAQIKVDRGGGVTVYCGTSDIGQDSDSMLAYIVAEELGVRVADIRVVSGDTDLTPVDLGSYSSRVTFMAGNAARTAAETMRNLIFEAAAEAMQVKSDRLASAAGRVFSVENPETSMSFADAACRAEEKVGTLVSVGSYTPPNLAGDYKGSGVGPSPAYSFTCACAEVEVDLETGELHVVRVTCAHDLGRALNPVICEGQIEGGMYMGFAEATVEEQVFRKGLHKQPSLLEYKIPTSLDVPDFTAMIVETIDAEGPFGAKEVGQGPLAPVVPAIANAVFDAIGIRCDSSPITADKILRALEARRKGLSSHAPAAG